MSSESDSDVFFDAEDVTPVRSVKNKGGGSTSTDVKDQSSGFQEPSVITAPLERVEDVKKTEAQAPSVAHFPVIQIDEDLKSAEKKMKESEKRRRKVEERRIRMLKDDDEVLEIPSEQSSLASSTDGIYPSTNSGHMTKLSSTNSDETRSVMSLGKIGSILGGKTKDPDATSSASLSESGSSYIDTTSTNLIKCSEPDVVASTKNSNSLIKPVAPPRMKRKNKPVSTSVTPTEVKDPFLLPEIPVVSSNDETKSLGKDAEYSLDIQSATRGQYVVKPQDFEQDRAEGAAPPPTVDNVEDASSCEAGPTEEKDKKKEEEPQPYMVRTRTDSGRPLTDQEILEQVKVVNLDTGEQIPLSLAEERLPKCLNPLSLHIMRLTSEYVSNTDLDKERESDEESVGSRKADIFDASGVWTKTKGIGKLIGKNIGNNIHKLRTVVVDKVHHSRHGGEEEVSDDDIVSDTRSNIEVKVSNKLRSVDKGRSEFDKIRLVQELSGEHNGAIWTMKFSPCGRLLATAGQDHDLRIWVLKDSFKFFDDMKQKYNAEGKSSPTPSQDSCMSSPNSESAKEEGTEGVAKGPFMEEPFCRYKGHTAELLDVSWSKNFFILSSSMDKTVRLWHMSRQECLCCFQHIDFVTAIAFHPRDDRYFLSGSLDGKLRLWNIPDKKVTLWHELDVHTKLITAVNFCENGKIAVVGSYDGRCIFYHTEQLKYHTQILVRRSRARKKEGSKISGIEAMPGEDRKILVTSNDSRIRLYDLRDLSLTCKYKGYVNLSSQIKASFSHDGRYIVSGSENQFIYIWKTFHDYAKSSRRDRNEFWERIKAHNAVVTSAVFSPNPSIILEQLERDQHESVRGINAELGASTCYVIVSADFNGTIKVFLHKSKTGATDTS